jgi:hypothetical protein
MNMREIIKAVLIDYLENEDSWMGSNAPLTAFLAQRYLHGHNYDGLKNAECRGCDKWSINASRGLCAHLLTDCVPAIKDRRGDLFAPSNKDWRDKVPWPTQGYD